MSVEQFNKQEAEALSSAFNFAVVAPALDKGKQYLVLADEGSSSLYETWKKENDTADKTDFFSVPKNNDSGMLIDVIACYDADALKKVFETANFVTRGVGILNAEVDPKSKKVNVTGLAFGPVDYKPAPKK